MPQQATEPFDRDSSAHLPEKVLCRVVETEAVLLNLETGIYFGLDEVGTRIVTLLQETPALASVHATLREEFDVDERQLWEDLESLLREMQEHGLIRIERTAK